MIRTLIADDEQHAIDRLQDLLSDYRQFEIVAESRNGSEALEQMVTLQPDVAFLDINMPGVFVFKSVASLQNPPLVVFQTAHSKYAAEAFDIDALDYLLKPVSRQRFRQTVDKIAERLKSAGPADRVERQAGKKATEKISIKVHDAIKIISVRDILRVRFEEGLVFVYTEEGRFMSDRTVNYYEEKFADCGFFRSDRANLVNLDHVATIHKEFKGNYLIELKDGSRIGLSRRKAQSLKKTLDF